MSPQSSSRSDGETVGLDQAPVRGVTPVRSGPSGIMVTDYDKGEMIWWPSWDVFQEHLKSIYLGGKSRVEFRDAGDSLAVDAVMEHDPDFVRNQMIARGNYATPFDTVTPEAIINEEDS